MAYGHSTLLLSTHHAAWQDISTQTNRVERAHLEDGPVLGLQLHEVGVLVDGHKRCQIANEGPAKGACKEGAYGSHEP
jgi:hypothetical protein